MGDLADFRIDGMLDMRIPVGRSPRISKLKGDKKSMKTQGQANPFMPAGQQAPQNYQQPQQQPAPQNFQQPPQQAPVQQPQQNFQPPAQQQPPAQFQAPMGAPMPGGTGFAGPAMSFDVDLTDVQTGFSVPDGDYLLKCLDVEQGVSQAGNSQFIWTFAIVGGDYNDKELKLFTALTPAAMWKVAETVTALGLGVVGQKVRFTRSEVVGRYCIGTLEEGEYKGVVRSSIIAVRPYVA